MTGEPQAGQEAAPPTLFDQDDNPDPTPAGGRRPGARSAGAAVSPLETATGPVGHLESTAEGSDPARLPMPAPGQPLVVRPSTYPQPSSEPAVAPDPFGLPAPLPPVTPAPMLAGPPPGARLIEAMPLGLPVDPTSGAGTGIAPFVAGMSPSVAGMPSAVAARDLRQPLVRPVPGRGRSAPQARKSEKRPSFRGTRRLRDRIGIWRKLMSFIELVIVVAVLGALLAAVIGIFIGAIVVALQKALNG